MFYSFTPFYSKLRKGQGWSFFIKLLLSLNRPHPCLPNPRDFLPVNSTHDHQILLSHHDLRQISRIHSFVMGKQVLNIVKKTDNDSNYRQMQNFKKGKRRYDTIYLESSTYYHFFWREKNQTKGETAEMCLYSEKWKA